MDDSPGESTAALEQWVTQLLMFDKQIDPDLPLGELGIDSLTAAELSAAIEDTYGAVIPMQRFLGDETLRDIARELEAGGASLAEPAGERTSG